MKKSKRENLLSPSSSWRENHNPPRRNSNSSAISSGCLPGFFKLFLCTFNFSSNRRKSITLGSKKQEQITIVYASPPEDASNVEGGGTVEPPLPRNEGVEEDAARVSLVGALEKCDRDLEELRRTIDVLKTAYLLQKKVSAETARDDFKFSSTVVGDAVVGTQMNKNTKTTLHETDTDTTMLSTMMNDHEYKNNTTYKVNHINLITRPDHYAMHDVIPKRATAESRDTAPIMVRRVRRSLMESVNEVSEDVESGQRREVGKIGLALHDHICRDLISETVHELSSFSHYDADECRKLTVDSANWYGRGSGRGHIRRGSTNSLPLDACRRKLVF
ncbi:hypothetical protein Bca4012_095462 [Brassica carinata]|uniref:Uncharacterized protein n=3 Tax=Brassica TaxID=3705 RepID=A0ABQ7YAI6_BRANA|nr:uncharacterized protein LOC125591153 [Brassica napus]KAG2258166.1 hypothetical protein Bca52824_077460 [Brassica carinata]KAH0865186.1 hypothetical protein HID58_082397 [Brassica napus]VDD57593.1 unnamed protein product [Brassica oleracea]